MALETDEKEFWSRLEFRVCREIEKMPAFRRQRLWCDGFIPEVYLLGQSPQSIAGAVWIASGSYQEQWRFRLFLPSPSSSSSQVAWSELVTHSLSLSLSLSLARCSPFISLRTYWLPRTGARPRIERLFRERFRTYSTRN